jgi:hypothetical protein
MEVKVEDAFSGSWEEARSRFRAAATAAGATLTVLEYDTSSFPPIWRGSSPAELVIDVAVLGDAERAPKLIVHSSGVHGVEGYAGSAIQVAFLRRVAARGGWASSASAPPTAAMLIVHGVNAHGMTQFRRWNESGVDLNRNLLIDGVTAGTLPDSPSQQATHASLATLPYTLYRKLYHLVNPTAVPLFWPRAHFLLLALLSITRHGFGALKQAIGGGQYLASEASKALPGLFYGGATLEQSHRLVTGFVRALCERRRQAHRPIDTLVHVDVHTGLGPSGMDTLLILDRDNDHRAATSVQAARDALAGSEGEARAEVNRDAAAGGTAYTLYGAYVDGLAQVANHASGGLARKAACVVQEFGTAPVLTVFEALRAEGALLRSCEVAPGTQEGWPGGKARAAAGPPPIDHPIRRQLREAFYPDDPVWRASVLARGLALVEHLTTSPS